MIEALFAKILGDELFGDSAGRAGNLFSGFQNYGNLRRTLKRLENLREGSLENFTNLGESVREGSQFLPFTTTSSAGGFNVDRDSFNVNLSPERQKLFDDLNRQAGLFLGQLEADPQDRAATILSNLQNLVRPNRQRQALDLDNRLRSQGRLGLNIGNRGTPEQYAQQAAFANQDRGFAVDATNQALKEQAQTAGLLRNVLGQADQLFSVPMGLSKLGGMFTGQRGQQQLAGEQGYLKALMQGYGLDNIFGLQNIAVQGQKDDAKSGFLSNLLFGG